MSTQETAFFDLLPRDPIITRDGRPQSAGNRMKSLDWPYPSVTAGSLRTLIGKQSNVDFADDNVQRSLKDIAVCGPFPVVDNELCLPAPEDISVRDSAPHVFSARPTKPASGEGMDLQPGLEPVLLNLRENEDEFKPVEMPAFWTLSRVVDWLCDATGTQFEIGQGEGFFDAPDADERFHVRMTSSGTAEDGALFSTSGRDLGRLPLPKHPPFCSSSSDETAAETNLAVRAGAESANSFSKLFETIEHWHPMGGERRLVHWKSNRENAALWTCPARVKDALSGATHVRMVLASPAIFEEQKAAETTENKGAWCPEWIDSTGDCPSWEGTVPGTSDEHSTGVRVRLVSASIARWQPVSGWSYEIGGPKAIRRIVPAGSVYFFEILSDSAETERLSDVWLESVSEAAENGQSARDGFGLALWGIWSRHD